jgi:hypothetical protein
MGSKNENHFQPLFNNLASSKNVQQNLAFEY